MVFLVRFVVLFACGVCSSRCVVSVLFICLMFVGFSVVVVYLCDCCLLCFVLVALDGSGLVLIYGCCCLVGGHLIVLFLLIL